MNLGKKLGYLRLHIRSITEHTDEPITIRKQIVDQIRKDLDAAEADMEAKEAARVAALLEDAGDVIEVAAGQEHTAAAAEVELSEEDVAHLRDVVVDVDSAPTPAEDA